MQPSKPAFSKGKDSNMSQPKISLQDDGVQMMGNSPEDPRLKKKLGFISALPSEFLIHFRDGRIREKSSGQGAVCFKYWRDTIFVIPTSLKEIVFEANQLTVDNVDVRIRGMAVYRINSPTRIYKLINFSNRQRAEDKLARMIGDMCRSTAKWLVANMKVEECIRKRKEEIAEALKKEVARVVADPTTGWGVEIVTIDIQDVYIRDDEIFNAMQMYYKSDKMRESKMAELEMQKNVEIKRLEGERLLCDHQKTTEMEKSRIASEIKEEQIRLARQSEEKQFALDRYRTEQAESMSDYKLHQEMDRDRQKMALEMERNRQQLTLVLEKAQKEVEAKKIANDEEIQSLKRRIEVENSASPVSLEREFITKAMPFIAQVMAQSMRDVKINIFQQDGQGGGGGTPFNFALAQIMQILNDRMGMVKGKEQPPAKSPQNQ